MSKMKLSERVAKMVMDATLSDGRVASPLERGRDGGLWMRFDRIELTPDKGKTKVAFFLGEIVVGTLDIESNIENGDRFTLTGFEARMAPKIERDFEPWDR
jgi:hypothetical protein